MSALTELLTRGHQLGRSSAAGKTASKISLKKVGEVMWCAASFLLFLALGPFSAIAAVMGVASLVSEQAEKMEPESIQ